MILDGWGIGKGDHTDAIAKANTPVIDHLLATAPHATLKTYGENVGLPQGQMGNSEVGHLNIGAGRIVYQMLVQINNAFAENSIQDLPNFKKFLTDCADQNRSIHLMGLVSNGGVHSSQEHLLELLRILNAHGAGDRTFIHAFLDGRDCDPNSGKGFVQDLLNDPRLGQSKLATLVGRYYAMDRDKRWERVKKAYDAMVNGIGRLDTNAVQAIEDSYENHITDEFLEPVITSADPKSRIKEGDVVMCFNFRTDRGRQITEALTQRAFHEQNMHPLALNYYTMTEYDKTFQDVNVIFFKQDLKMTLGEYLETQHCSQLRAAETEKYPHVTYFFSGGREEPFQGENRILAPSPKVATYDLKPEMSAIELKDKVRAALETEEHDFICINFANPDMVGHTGVFPAIVKACETVDACVGELLKACSKHGYHPVIIADHGNADNAVNPDGSPNTAHSVNPVPIIFPDQTGTATDGILADVAPSILKLMKLEQPAEMTGQPLI
ncbi:MAG: 2,3-bisphosphoglycerate-independent phosphoglycerate mutase [Bacteroidetes bacterium]|nr:2,3-bisphosphoglycerate-independent phosphoglycerate mutase [Bacteroidota bacterium]